jgi:hypothetical protein
VEQEPGDPPSAPSAGKDRALAHSVNSPGSTDWVDRVI